MKKATKLMLGFVTMLLAVVVLTGCNSDHDIVGTWTWDLESSWVYTFDADGTGTLNAGAMSWDISGDVLTITMDGIPMRWVYSIAGDTLTLRAIDTDDELEFIYFRQ